jgi:uncharacterized membrane protein YkvA (DUF1232 family)
MKLTKSQKVELRRAVAAAGATTEKEVRARFPKAERKARARGAAAELLERVRLLWRMINDDSYELSAHVRAWLIVSLLYFVAPLDCLPDPVPFIGYVDDLAVIAWSMHEVSHEVDHYMRVKGIG